MVIFKLRAGNEELISLALAVSARSATVSKVAHYHRLYGD